MFKKIKKFRLRSKSSIGYVPLDKQSLLYGKIASRQVHALKRLCTLADAEFCVTSQWGEDGIIEWLCHQLPDIPTSFVEFGVENYTEANTRFLLQNRNWRGLIIDSSRQNMDRVGAEELYWRHSLIARTDFVTVENVNQIIRSAGFEGAVGILSVDIDGNDYWVLRQVNVIQPAILIVEVNTVFGDKHAITIPYDPQFSRFKAHYSGQYFGASIVAMKQLAESMQYQFVGTTNSGVNAFFIRNDLANVIVSKIEKLKAYRARHRDARNLQGELTYLATEKCVDLIADMPVYDLRAEKVVRISDLLPLYSDNWVNQE